MRTLLISVFTSLIIGFVAGFLVQANLFHPIEDDEIVIPTGFEQKEAVGEDVEQQEVFIEEEYQKLLDELSVTSDDPYSYIGGRNEAVLSELISYNDIFPVYRDTSCEIYALQMYMGTGASGIFLSCVNEINKEYIELLKLIRSMYIDDNTASTID